MRSVQKVLSCLVLALTVSASIPSRAETGETPGVAPRVDFRGLQGASALGTALPLKAQMQTSGTTSSGGMSGKKKAWIIVGSVLGAVAIGAAVSHHGGGGGSSSSGGGGGY